jgi:hypothetical protein
MKKAIILCFLLASFAMSQRQRVVVLPSLADPDAKLTPKQLDLLTEDIRTIVARTLPNTAFNLLKQDEVMKKLGDQAFVRACKEGVCLGSLMEDVDANFGARCEVSAVGGQLYLRFELYGTLKGQSGAGTIDQFNDPVKNFADIQAKIKAKVPGIFEMIIKSPQEICEAKGKEWAWINGDCKSSTQIAREACVSIGNTWINGECKSQAQIACEVMVGRKWIGEECKTNEQIECEKKDGRWDNGICKNKEHTEREMVGNYFVAKITTIPAGATLLVNGMPYVGCERTPCSVSAYDNKIRLTALLNDYNTADTTIAITQPNQPVSIKLAPKTFSVHFASLPPQAQVSFEEANNSCPQTPCKVELKRGNAKIHASLDLYDSKDTTILISGDNQLVQLNLTPNYGTLKLKTKGEGWSLTVENKQIPINDAKLSPGTYNAKLTNGCYEDITFSTTIKRGEEEVLDFSNVSAVKCGTLEIKSDYGKWNLTIGDKDNKYYNLHYMDKALLVPGTYKIYLRNETPECYEDINFDAEIRKGETSAYSVFTRLKPRKANLALYVKYKGRDQKEPVFVDEKEVGNTPFKELIPACSKNVEFGKDKMKVNIDGLKLGGVEYTHEQPTLKSTLLSIAIGFVSGALLFHAYDLNTEASFYMDEYNNLGSGRISEYDRSRKLAKDAKDKVPFYLISGGVLAVSAVGVYIWF